MKNNKMKFSNANGNIEPVGYLKISDLQSVMNDSSDGIVTNPAIIEQLLIAQDQNSYLIFYIDDIVFHMGLQNFNPMNPDMPDAGINLTQIGLGEGGPTVNADYISNLIASTGQLAVPLYMGPAMTADGEPIGLDESDVVMMADMYFNEMMGGNCYNDFSPSSIKIYLSNFNIEGNINQISIDVFDFITNNFCGVTAPDPGDNGNDTETTYDNSDAIGEIGHYMIYQNGNLNITMYEPLISLLSQYPNNYLTFFIGGTQYYLSAGEAVNTAFANSAVEISICFCYFRWQRDCFFI